MSLKEGENLTKKGINGDFIKKARTSSKGSREVMITAGDLNTISKNKFC